MDVERFEPVLGRIRAKPSTGGQRFLSRVLRAANRSGTGRRGVSKFIGSRIGRGWAVGRVLSSRDRSTTFRSRRTIVKTRIVRLGRTGAGGFRAHLRYLERDGVQRDGAPGALYGAGEDRVDRRAFFDRCAGDRHQFRIILSAEDGDQYEDLKPLVRRLMTRMEVDLRTRLDWVAVDHFDTGRPHSHVVLRGKDELAENLVIAREYITHGIRERLTEIVNLDLGPRQDLEMEQMLRKDVESERVTVIDRALVRDLQFDGSVEANHCDPLFHALRTARLRKLESLGLAQKLGAGRWSLADGFEETLCELGERIDIARTMQRQLSSAGIMRSAAEQVVHSGHLGNAVIVGRVVARGLHDEHRGIEYLIIDGVDGRAHHLRIGAEDDVEPVVEGAIVRVLEASPGPRPAAAVSDEPRWAVRPVRLDVLSPLALEQLPERQGATLLDRLLSGTEVIPARDAGFGAEVRSALAIRRSWLVDQELADERDGELVLRPRTLQLLRQRELAAAGGQLAEELGLEHAPDRDGRVSGVYRRRVDLASGRFVLLQDGREFALAPWRPVLERYRGREIAGDVRGSSVNWHLGRALSVGR